MAIETKQIEARAEQVAGPILENLGYSLVACEFIFEEGRWLLRFYIDREGGVTMDDCVTASHGIEDPVAVEEFIPVRYSLEVSSPGVFRPLRRREDFERFAGERIKLKTIEPIDGRSNFKGLLAGLDGDDIVISIDGTKFRVPLDKVGRARLEPESISMRETASH